MHSKKRKWCPRKTSFTYIQYNYTHSLTLTHSGAWERGAQGSFPYFQKWGQKYHPTRYTPWSNNTNNPAVQFPPPLLLVQFAPPPPLFDDLRMPLVLFMHISFFAQTTLVDWGLLVLRWRRWKSWILPRMHYCPRVIIRAYKYYSNCSPTLKG